MPFIHEDFLLSTDAARRLYHRFAAEAPILDYHNHLPPKDIAENRRFHNLFEIWLEGDHYKWRAMRANGVEERFCTGAADPHEKYLAWARTVPATLRNPLYHWTHLELKRYFGIDRLLSERTAAAVWERANEQLGSRDDLTAQGILRKFRVRALCTTDDPADDLSWHHAIARAGLETRVYPAFRPDRALTVHQPEAWNGWVDRLAAATDVDIGSYPALLEALRRRHEAFHRLGSRLSDHGLPHAYADFCSDEEAAAIFDRARSGVAASPPEHARFAANLMLYFGQLDAARGWTKQLHLGPLRNNSSRVFLAAGPDAGVDSMSDGPQVEALGRYLDRLDREDALPKLIVYNMNPAQNFAIATMIGNFQDGKIAGKMQYGSAWWYLDQKEGMEAQLNTLSNVGLLSRFVGMLTDSRSFMSFPRHEYFRRILCNLLGRDVAKGELPDDDDLLGPLVRNICYDNAREFLGLEA